jgi:uncharacterized protein DUF3551
MRIVLIGLAIVTMNLADGVELAGAQSHPPRPYCLQAGRGGPGGGLPFCAFYTMEQCLQSVGGGTDGCFPNPEIAWDRIEGKRYAQPPRGKTRDRGY